VQVARHRAVFCQKKARICGLSSWPGGVFQPLQKMQRVCPRFATHLQTG
jgi:hypothetical protein